MSVVRQTLAAAALIAACVPLFAQQADRARTEALARRAGDRLQALQREAEALASEERTLLGDVRRLEVDREIKAEELRQITARASGAARELTAVDEQLQRLEREDLEARPELRARIVELYKLGQGRYLRLLLSMSDVRSIGQASRMVAALAKRDRDRAAAAEARVKALTASRQELEGRGKELAALRAEAERTQAAADRAVAARNELIRKIDAQRDLNAQLAGELLAAEQKLQLTLRNLGSGGKAVVPAALPFRPFRGDLDWPVAGTVRRLFRGSSAAGRPAANGIEIAAPEGTPVRAVHDGTVAFADSFVGFGKLVILEHESQTFTLYGNLSDIGVTRGSQVQQGQELGLTGPTATSLTPEPGVYFELRVDGRPVDPLQWLRRK